MLGFESHSTSVLLSLCVCVSVPDFANRCHVSRPTRLFRYNGSLRHVSAERGSEASRKTAQRGNSFHLHMIDV